MTAETDDQTTVFTESDRKLLTEIHGLMTSLIPYLPLLERAARLLDRNPAAKWRQKHGGMGGIDPHG